MTPITFRVTGEPKAQPRPRAFARKFGNTYSARVYTPGTAEAWKGEIARVAEQHRPPVPFTRAVPMAIVFIFARPAGHYGTGRNADRLKPSAPAGHLCKPDVDNLSKCVMDVLMTLGFFRDDGQVNDLRVRKRWAERGELAGAEVLMQPADAVNVIGPAAAPVALFAEGALK